MHAFTWSDTCSNESPCDRKPKTKTTQSSIFTILNTIISKSTYRTQRSHHPKYHQLSLFRSPPPINHIHSKIEIARSNHPPQIKGPDISYYVGENINFILWSVSHLDPCQENRHSRSNDSNRSKNDWSQCTSIKKKNPCHLQKVVNAKVNVSF